MTSAEFEQLRATFERAIAAPPPERSVILEEFSLSSPPLGEELSRMLAAHSNLSSVLDKPVVDLAAEPLREGAEFGSYRLERELGRGGMGVVYRASRSDGSFQKQVAIKILRHDRIDDSFVRRFQQERQILAQLNHPHIASILDGGVSSAGDPYFVMEYVEGVPLSAYLKAHHPSEDQKLDLFLQICDAVRHAHRNLVVHRDLKPGNILVTDAGAVKLLDFGIAKLLSPVSDVRSEPSPTVVILTPDYASPEQILREPITTSSDVFALGILLYEMLAGEHPFRRPGRTPHEVMDAICREDPATPLGGEIGAIITTALRKQPSWRYPSVEQLADDISRYRRGWPVLAKGDGFPYRVRKFVRRHWIPIAAASLIAASLIVGIVATTHEASIAFEARAAAERDRQRADEARETANEQRSLAEARTREAEDARRKAQDRYRQVRALAASLLFDLHDGIRDLAGSTTARRLIVGKAQRQLELLSADAGNDDIELQRDLAASYERMGELRVDPHHSDKNDAAAAVDAYRHAVDLRRKIASRKDAVPRDREDLALSIAKLGDGQFFASDTKQALESYNSAWTLARTLPSAQHTLGAIDERRCVGLLTAGRTSAALETCREGIATLAPLAKASPDDVEVERMVATTEASYANALRLSQQPKEAAVEAKRAVESLHRLELLAPSNAEYRRLASSAEAILASSLASAGDEAASITAYRRSVEAMQVAMAIDPTDLGAALRLAVTLRLFSQRLAKGGNKDAARESAVEALRLLEQTAAQSAAGPVEWNEYADALLKVDWPELRQPGKALQLAQDAVDATKRTNPFFLDTLAWAHFLNGRAAVAAQTERDALALLPAGSKGGLQYELERGLKTFLSPPR